MKTLWTYKKYIENMWKSSGYFFALSGVVYQKKIRGFGLGWGRVGIFPNVWAGGTPPSLKAKAL